jgi:hypothetical protein
VNALHLADDRAAAVAELARVTVPGGVVAVAGWAEAHRNDVHAVERALAELDGQEPVPDDALRVPGGLEHLLRDGGLEVVEAGLVEVPWQARDADTLVAAVLLGEDPEGMALAAPTVLAAAAPFRDAAGGYRLVDALRYAVGRRAR